MTCGDRPSRDDLLRPVASGIQHRISARAHADGGELDHRREHDVHQVPLAERQHDPPACLRREPDGMHLDAIGPDLKRFTAETLPEFELLIGEANVLTSSLRRLSEHVERSPGGLLIGRRPLQPGPGE